MRRFLITRVALGCAGLLLAGCASPPATREPANLFLLKQQVQAYVDGGAYLRDIEAVAARAREWIERRAAQGGPNLTVVFDLDETLLWNWPHLQRMDFGYLRAEWDRWVEEAKAPAIEPVRDVYRRARELGVAVVFITGRRESARAGTERNLRAIECTDYVALICKPEGHQGTSEAFKTAARQALVAQGRTIIANLGDQQSDLAGGFAERTFKFPNPFYFTQ